jgi:putative transposase
MASTGRRYTEEQIIAILKEAEAAKSAAEVIRRHGITPHTFYRWKAKYAGLEVSEARRLKALEDENRRLKRIVASQTLDIQVLKELLGKD